jgi:hypothetical protein
VRTQRGETVKEMGPRYGEPIKSERKLRGKKAESTRS